MTVVVLSCVGMIDNCVGDRDRISAPIAPKHKVVAWTCDMCAYRPRPVRVDAPDPSDSFRGPMDC
jgi:hypothetical protein